MWVVPLLAALAAGAGHVPAVMPSAVMPVTALATAPQPSPETAAPPIGDSLRRLAAALGATDGRLPRRMAEWPQRLRQAHERTMAALTVLIGLSNNWPRDTPEDYRRQLAATAGLVDRAIRNADGAPRLETLIEPLADDLETKLGHCQASGGRLGGLVTVQVRTVRGAREDAAWQVLVLPRIFEDAPGAAPTPFPKLSSPTASRVVPGRYLLWARDPVNGRASERLVLVVGNGQTGLDVDLPVPSATPR